MGRILVIHGPNLNLLGTRETGIYGTASLDDINNMVEKEAEELGLAAEFYQSNHEGDIIDRIHSAIGKHDCIIINPGAYTHYSIAIRDAIAAVDIPAIEVHMSNVYGRESFRHTSMIAPVAAGQIAGFGPFSYVVAVRAAAILMR